MTSLNELSLLTTRLMISIANKDDNLYLVGRQPYRKDIRTLRSVTFHRHAQRISLIQSLLLNEHIEQVQNQYSMRIYSIFIRAGRKNKI